MATTSDSSGDDELIAHVPGFEQPEREPTPPDLDDTVSRSHFAVLPVPRVPLSEDDAIFGGAKPDEETEPHRGSDAPDWLSVEAPPVFDSTELIPVRDRPQFGDFGPVSAHRNRRLAMVMVAVATGILLVVAAVAAVGLLAGEKGPEEVAVDAGAQPATTRPNSRTPEHGETTIGQSDSSSTHEPAGTTRGDTGASTTAGPTSTPLGTGVGGATAPTMQGGGGPATTAAATTQPISTTTRGPTTTTRPQATTTTMAPLPDFPEPRITGVSSKGCDATRCFLQIDYENTGDRPQGYTYAITGRSSGPCVQCTVSCAARNCGWRYPLGTSGRICVSMTLALVRSSDGRQVDSKTSPQLCVSLP